LETKDEPDLETKDEPHLETTDEPDVGTKDEPDLEKKDEAPEVATFSVSVPKASDDASPSTYDLPGSGASWTSAQDQAPHIEARAQLRHVEMRGALAGRVEPTVKVLTL
jgi:hypothetical protein